MNWLHRFLLANWSWLMDGMLLLMALIIGIQVGESHVHKEWNAEKSKNEQLAAKLEQHVADVKLMQNQINQEISNDFSKKSKLLAERLPDHRSFGVCNSSAGVIRDLPPVSETATGTSATGPYAVPSPSGVAAAISCEKIIQDAAQTTLMLDELQRWQKRQEIIVN
jgi:uncharacterized membrane-anchored protein YhcB (DUF1043 family)